MKLEGGLAINRLEKASCLAKYFFPKAPSTNLSNIEGTHYLVLMEFPPIMENEIHKAIAATSAKSAAGSNEIPNRILKLVLPLLLSPLVWLFNASLNQGYYPQHFRNSITVSFRKKGKDNYQVPKAYRPIALLNTLGKALEAVISTRLGWAAETFDLFPRGHIRGRRGTSPEHAIHSLIEAIHATWNNKGVASLLLLDVTGAFDNVSQLRLIHNLRKRRIGDSMWKWITSFLKDRTIIFRPVDFTTERFETAVGIPQGSLLLPILYLFYNSDLIETCTDVVLNSTTSGFIDDIAVLVRGELAEENLLTLQSLYTKTIKWSLTHASKFDLAKYKLIHFRPKVFTGPRLPLKLLDKALIPIQARAGKIIAGAFKTTSSSALDVKLFLRPVNLQLDVFLYNALLRIASSPAYTYIKSFRNHSSVSPDNPQFKHLSPLHKLELRFSAVYKKDLDNLETRCLFPALPWYKAPFITIATAAKEAIATHNQLIRDPNILTIYTDGSGINQKIRVSAVTMFTPYPGAYPIIS